MDDEYPITPTLRSTEAAARELGLSSRSLLRWVAQGLIRPDLTLPSGGYRWDLDTLYVQLDRVRRRSTDRDGPGGGEPGAVSGA